MQSSQRVFRHTVRGATQQYQRSSGGSAVSRAGGAGPPTPLPPVARTHVRTTPGHRHERVDPKLLSAYMRLPSVSSSIRASVPRTRTQQASVSRSSPGVSSLVFPTWSSAAGAAPTPAAWSLVAAGALAPKHEKTLLGGFSTLACRAVSSAVASRLETPITPKDAAPSKGVLSTGVDASASTTTARGPGTNHPPQQHDLPDESGAEKNVDGGGNERENTETVLTPNQLTDRLKTLEKKVEELEKSAKKGFTTKMLFMVKEYGAPFAVYYGTCYFSCLAGIYFALSSGMVPGMDVASIVDLLGRLGFENVVSLEGLAEGRTVHLALAFLLNEAVEMPRFLFVAGTLKPVGQFGRCSGRFYYDVEQ